MKRRTLVRKLGAAGIATTAISGSAGADRPPIDDLGIDREFDVSSIEGQVTLDELLEPAEVESLPDDVDPSGYTLTIAPAADVTTLSHCCPFCCGDQVFKQCNCSCCVCDDDLCWT